MKLRRERGGGYRIHLEPWQKNLLANLIPQLRDLLIDGSSDMLRRLYPTAHPGDVEADAAYQELVHDQLLATRLDALDVVESQLEATHLDEEQLGQWLQAINSIRLVVGTRLDVSEDDNPFDVADDDADRDLWIIYHLLTEMLATVVDALSG